MYVKGGKGRLWAAFFYMTLTVGRVKQGDLLLAGEIDERVAPNKNGLVAYYPLDGTTDTSSLWKEGASGTQVSNSAVHDLGYSSYPLQPGQTLRFTGWFKKSGGFNGSFWFYAYQQHTPSGGTATWSYNSAQFTRTFPEDEWTYCESTFTLGYTGETITSQGQGVTVRADATTGTLEWKNCHCYVTNPAANESGITYTDNGMILEEGTTNLVITKGWSTEGTTNPELPPGCPVTPVISSKVAKGDWLELFRTTVSQTLVAGDSYTVSGWFYAKGASGEFNCNAADSGNSNRAIGSHGIAKHGWNYFTWTYKNDTGADLTITSIRVEAGYTGYTTTWINGDNEAWGCNYQIEWSKDYATAFVNGTRSGTASLTLPGNVGNNFTIFYKFVPDKFWQNSMATTWTNRTIWTAYDKLTGKNIAFLDYFNPTVTTTVGSNPWINFDAFISNHWHYNDTQWSSNKEYWFALTKNSAGVYTKYFIDDVGFRTQALTHTDGALVAFQLDKMVFSGNFNWKIKDLMIYNIVLTQDEVIGLTKKSFSISKEGNAITNIIEAPNTIKDGTDLFPFGLDGRNFTKTVSPVAEQNTIYEDGAVWVGQPTTNLIDNTDWSNWSTNYITSIQYEDRGPHDIQSKVISFIDADGNGNGFLYCYTDHAPQDPSVTYTISVWVKTEAPFTFRAYTADTVEVGRQYTNSVTVQPDEWTRVVFNPITTPADTTSDSLSFTLDSIAAGKRVWMCAPQMESKSYATPFAVGTRAETNLHLPYDVVDMTKNFTICGWWKPYTVGNSSYNGILTYNKRSAQTTNQRILIMEAGTTLNYPRVWLPKDGTAENAIVLSTSAIIQLGEWNFFALKRTGTDVWLYHGANGSGFNSGTNVGGAVGFDYLATVADSNWGWLVGEYATGYASTGNAYYRDYAFIPSALSDTDIEALYRNQMRAYKDNRVQIQGQAREGKVL